MNREHDATITSTGNTTGPACVITGVAGNKRLHYGWSPAANDNRSAGSFGSCSGRSNATFFRNHDTDPDQPTRSAITVAGIAGNSASSCRTRTSNSSHADGTAGLEYDGRPSKANAFLTVSRAIPRCSAIALADSPKLPCRCRISPHSFTVITQPICLGGLVFEERRQLSGSRTQRRQTYLVEADLIGLAGAEWNRSPAFCRSWGADRLGAHWHAQPISPKVRFARTPVDCGHTSAI